MLRRDSAEIDWVETDLVLERDLALRSNLPKTDLVLEIDLGLGEDWVETDPTLGVNSAFNGFAFNFEEDVISLIV